MKTPIVTDAHRLFAAELYEHVKVMGPNNSAHLVAEFVDGFIAKETKRAEAAEALNNEWKKTVDAIEWGGAHSEVQVYNYQHVVDSLDHLSRITPAVFISREEQMSELIKKLRSDVASAKSTTN